MVVSPVSASGLSGTFLARPARSASRVTARVCPAAVPATWGCAENASRSALHPAEASTTATRPHRRMPSPLGVRVLQDRCEGTYQPGADGLAAQPAESQGQRHRPPYLRLELHRVERHRQASETRLRLSPKREPRLVALDEDRLQSPLGAERAELGHEEQALRFVAETPEAVAQLLAHRLNLARLLSPRPTPVQIELRPRITDVRVGQMRRLVQDDFRRPEGSAPRSPLSVFQRHDRFLEPAQVHVEPYGLRVPRLLAAEQVSSAPQLEIAQRDAISRAQVGVVFQHAQSL